MNTKTFAGRESEILRERDREDKFTLFLSIKELMPVGSRVWYCCENGSLLINGQSDVDNTLYTSWPMEFQPATLLKY